MRARSINSLVNYYAWLGCFGLYYYFVVDILFKCIFFSTNNVFHIAMLLTLHWTWNISHNNYKSKWAKLISHADHILRNYKPIAYTSIKLFLCLQTVITNSQIVDSSFTVSVWNKVHDSTYCHWTEQSYWRNASSWGYCANFRLGFVVCCAILSKLYKNEPAKSPLNILIQLLSSVNI